MKKIFSFKSFLLIMFIISLIAWLVSWFSNLEFLAVFFICLGAVLINGLIITVLDD